MLVALNTSHFPIPPLLAEALAERKELKEKAWADKGGGAVFEKEQRLGVVNECDLINTLICLGIGDRKYPSDPIWVTQIILGAACGVLNYGYVPECTFKHRPHLRYGVLHSCYVASCFNLTEDGPISKPVAACIYHMFKPEYGGGHYQEGSVSSEFTTYYRSREYADHWCNEFVHLRHPFIRHAEETIKDIQPEYWEDVRKIVALIPHNLDLVTQYLAATPAYAR